MRIVTEVNEEHHPGSRLNLQLGYKPEPAWIDFIHELEPQE
jgi:hypothetical protein